MERYEMFKSLMVMAAANRSFSEQEVEWLTLRSNRWGITDDQFEEALQYATQPGAKVTIPEDEGDQLKLLRGLLELMAADGELSEEEKRIFADASARMGVTGHRLDALIDEML